MGKTLAKRYICEVKLLLPSVRRQERTYLSKMKDVIDDFCQERSITDMDAVYQEFGTPSDTVANYFTTMDAEQLLRLLRIQRLKKGFLISLTFCTTAFLLFLGIILYQEHLMFMRQEALFIDTVITIEGEQP